MAADGVIRIVSSDSYATIIEINSETDFAAKDPGFIAFADDVVNYVSNNKVDDISMFASTEIEEKRLALIQKNW